MVAILLYENQVEETDRFFVTEKYFDDCTEVRVLTPKVKVDDHKLEECTELYLERKHRLETSDLKPKAKSKVLKDLEQGYLYCMRFINYQLSCIDTQKERFNSYGKA